MSVVKTTFTVIPTEQLFVGAGGMDKINTFIPRSELIFSRIAGVVILSGSGDTQHCSIVINLPRGYGYVLSDWSFYLRETVSGDLLNWDAAPTCYLVDSPTDPTWIKHVAMGRAGLSKTDAGLNQYTYYASDLCTKMIIPKNPPNPDAGDTGRLQCDITCQTTNQAALLIYCFAKFLKFDLNQAWGYMANTPIPVR